MKRVRSVFTTLALAVLLSYSGCSGDGDSESNHGSGGGGFGGHAGGSGGSSDSGSPDGARPDSGDGTATDAPLAPVKLGIVPIAHSEDGGSGLTDQTLAHLEVLAAGSRGVSLIRRWDALFTSPTAPDASEWTQLQKAATLYHGSGRGILFCVAVVDHTLDARPTGLLGGWNDAGTVKALDALVDQVFAAFGSELVALSFGNQVDRYLAQASASDRDSLLVLLQHGVDYARAHPARPASTLIGVTLGADAVVAQKLPEVAKLLGFGDIPIISYSPVDSSFKVKPPSVVADDLDALSALLANEAGQSSPFLLQDVSYPSATDNGSSLAQQKNFYEALFGALATRRERIPFVSVLGLYDADPATCAQQATALGAPSNALARASLCSLGLKTNAGDAKPAFSTVLDALATFATP